MIGTLGKIFIGLFVFVIVVSQCTPNKSRETEISETLPKTDARWLGHKAMLEYDLEDLSSQENVYEMNKTADRLRTYKYDRSRCDLTVCAEMRTFLSTVRDATDDGFITPEEVRNIARLSRYVGKTIREADEVYLKNKLEEEKRTEERNPKLYSPLPKH